MSASTELSSRFFRSRRLLLLVLLLSAAGLLWLGRHYLTGQDGDTAWPMAVVQRGDLEDLVAATGTLQPRDYVDVGAQVSGQLKVIHVEVGSEVAAGELLAEIDPTLLMTRVDASRAQLRYQRAQLQDRQAQLRQADSHHRRQMNLAAEGAAAAEVVQQAETALLSARAQIEMLSAQIEQTESTLRADEANLGYARIIAPMTGTVVAITARQGQTINASQQAPVILRIADLSTMSVQTKVSEADISRLRLGMEAYFTTLGDQSRRWYGQLYRIEPTPTLENNVVLYNALFDVDNAVGQLLPQMTAQVFFVVARVRDALLVPVAAVNLARPGSGGGQERSQTAGPVTGRRPEGSGEQVRSQSGSGSGRRSADTRTTVVAGMAGEESPKVGRPATVEESPKVGRPATVTVLLADGVTESRAVSVGVGNRVHFQVLSGLAEGERVVLTGGQSGREGGNRAAGGNAVGGVGGLAGQGIPRMR